MSGTLKNSRNIKSIQRNPNLTDMFISSHSAMEGVYFDINDGLHIKKKKKNVLQIQPFFDKFETAIQISLDYALKKVFIKCGLYILQ